MSELPAMRYSTVGDDDILVKDGKDAALKDGSKLENRRISNPVWGKRKLPSGQDDRP